MIIFIIIITSIFIVLPGNQSPAIKGGGKWTSFREEAIPKQAVSHVCFRSLTPKPAHGKWNEEVYWVFMTLMTHQRLPKASQTWTQIPSLPLTRSWGWVSQVSVLSSVFTSMGWNGNPYLVWLSWALTKTVAGKHLTSYPAHSKCSNNQSCSCYSDDYHYWFAGTVSWLPLNPKPAKPIPLPVSSDFLWSPITPVQQAHLTGPCSLARLPFSSASFSQKSSACWEGRLSHLWFMRHGVYRWHYINV